MEGLCAVHDFVDLGEAVREWVHGRGPGWHYAGTPMRRVDRPGDTTAWLGGARVYAWWRRRWLDRDGVAVSVERMEALVAS